MKGGCQVSKGNSPVQRSVLSQQDLLYSCRLDPESKMLEKIQKMLTIRSSSIRELLAEALGMYVLMVRKRCAQMCVFV